MMVQRLSKHQDSSEWGGGVHPSTLQHIHGANPMRSSDRFFALILFSALSLIWVTISFKRNDTEKEPKDILTWMGFQHDNRSNIEQVSRREMDDGSYKEVHRVVEKKDKVEGVGTHPKKPSCKPIDWGLGLYCCDGEDIPQLHVD